MLRLCRECRWCSGPSFLVADGEIKPPEDGDEDFEVYSCDWPAERLPYSLAWANRERTGVHWGTESHCPCWELRGEK